MNQGAVKIFYGARGFGFVKPDDGGADVFFHVTQLVNPDIAATLSVGTRLAYDTAEDRNGRGLRAVRVRLAKEAA